MAEDPKEPSKFERLIKERPEAFDDADCRPLRTIEEIGMSVPDGLLDPSEKMDTEDSKE
ncbi:MAG: hypothetical protein WCB49_02980 [Gammaproteobacteria bacterium]